MDSSRRYYFCDWLAIKFGWESSLNYRCPYCPCFFCSSKDLGEHLKFLVYPLSVQREVRVNREDHIKLYEKLHREIEFGFFNDRRVMQV